MSREESRINIAALAEMLEERKKNNRNIALILGSRVGALFRSSQFIKEITYFSGTSPRYLFDTSEREYFSECYASLEKAKKQRNSSDLRNFLEQKIKDVDFSPSDRFLADLVKQGIFSVILYCNPDDIIYDAFRSEELGVRENFIEFSIDTFTFKEALDGIVNYEKINACKVLKLYKDVEAFVYSLGNSQEQEELGRCVKSLLERLWIKEVLIVGLDLRWDHIILSALPSRVKTVWFANEDEPEKNAFHSTYGRIESFRPISGGYEKILKALYIQINPVVLPRSYELMSSLQNQLRLIQRDLASIKGELKDLQTKVDQMQIKVTKMRMELLEEISNNRNERE
jgi:hypothetical protein